MTEGFKNNVIRFILGLLEKENITNFPCIASSYIKLFESYGKVYLRVFSVTGCFTRKILDVDTSFLMGAGYQIKSIIINGDAFSDYSVLIGESPLELGSYDVWFFNNVNYRRLYTPDCNLGVYADELLEMRGLRYLNEVLQSWNYEENDALPYEIGRSNKKRSIICLGCGRRVLKDQRSLTSGFCNDCNAERGTPQKYGYLCDGTNVDLIDLNSRLLESQFLLEDLGATSTKRIRMICHNCGVEYTEEVCNVLKGLCKNCSKKERLLERNGSLADLPFSKEFDVVANGVTPNKVTKRSKEVYWWVCPKGHKYQESVERRALARRSGYDYRNLCPYCSRSDNFISTCKGKYGSVADTVFASEFDVKRNGVNPEDVFKNSRDVYWWKCSRYGHSFLKKPRERVHSDGSCPICLGREVLEGFNDVGTLKKDLVPYWIDSEKSYTEVTSGSSYEALWKCKKCGKTFRKRVVDTTSALCSDCIESASSRGEEEIALFVESLGFWVIRSYRLSVQGVRREIDIYVPEVSIGFEFNGIYWHSDKFREKEYHREKWDLSEKAGISLYGIWEDTYNSNEGLVKRFIKRKLGCSDEEKVGARSCSVTTESLSSEVKDFLTDNHMQGFVPGEYYICLRDAVDVLVGVFVIGFSNGEYTIKRYCTSKIVQGGFSKVLAYVKRNLGIKYLVTFSDRMVSDGSLYSRNGFVKVAELPEDYSYVQGGKRVHKFNYRKEKFRKDVNLYYEDGLTEKELADMNGLHRCWDAGKVKWRLDF